MTHRDLEEAITNLEYLVLNHFDPMKVEEYEHHLGAIRKEMQSLNGNRELLSQPYAACHSRFEKGES